MKKLLFALVATLAFIVSSAQPIETPSQTNPVCPVTQPCEYSGPAKVYNPRINEYVNISASIKVVYSGTSLVGVVVSSSSSGINDGESGYVKKAPDNLRPYTHYFMANGYWFCFKM